MIKYYLMVILSALIAAFSQMLLKKAANNTYKNKVLEYLNMYVIIGYGLMFASMLCNVYAFKGLDYKIVTVFESIGYIFVLVFSKIFFNEEITKKKLIGNALIVLGIIVFCI